MSAPLPERGLPLRTPIHPGEALDSWVEILARRSGPPDKEQRISRQEREYDKTRFKKDNEEQDKVCPDTIFMDYGNHILVDMKKKGDQRIYHRFWKIMYSVSILT